MIRKLMYPFLKWCYPKGTYYGKRCSGCSDCKDDKRDKVLHVLKSVEVDEKAAMFGARYNTYGLTNEEEE